MEKGQFTQSGFPDQANCPFEMIPMTPLRLPVLQLPVFPAR